MIRLAYTSVIGTTQPGCSSTTTGFSAVSNVEAMVPIYVAVARELCKTQPDTYFLFLFKRARSPTNTATAIIAATITVDLPRGTASCCRT